MNTTATLTKVSRNFRNEISATTYFHLTNGKQLRVSTWKGLRGLTTNFQAVEVGKGTESFLMFQDFSRSVNHPEFKRATEKTIREAHEIAIKNIEAVIEEANKFYEAKEK